MWCLNAGESVNIQSYHYAPWAGGVGQDHVHHHFVWRNAKLFYCFSSWEKDGLHFQCTLKNIYHEQTTKELFISLCTLQCACTKQLCTCRCSFTENISERRLFYPTQVFSIRHKVSRATTPQQTSALEMLVFCCFCMATSCISRCTILCNVNLIKCT